MSQERRALRLLLSESVFSDLPDDVSSKKIPHHLLPSDHHHLPALPVAAHALTVDDTQKDSLSRTLARAMNTLDHNRDEDWNRFGHRSLSKCPHNTDPQTGSQLPTAKTKLFFNHVQTPSSSSSSPSSPASSTRLFRPIARISPQPSPYYPYLDHLSTMTGPIRTKDVVDSRPPSASGSNPTSTTATAGPSSSRPSRSKNPPRPLNAWIIYRKQMLQELLKEPENKRLPQSELSKKISKLWKAESNESRARFEYEANISKAQHQKDYPDYQFRPRKRVDKERERAERKEELDRERAERRLAKLNKRALSSSAGPAGPHPVDNNRPSSPRPSGSQPTQTPSAPGTEQHTVHSFMVQRYGVCGPSPPLSQAPSPYGSPSMGGFSLDAPQDAVPQSSTEQDASFPASRHASAFTSAAPGVDATRRPSVSRGQSVPVAHPRPVIPIRPPTVTGWNGGVPPVSSAMEAPISSQHHPDAAQVGAGAEGSGAMWAQDGTGYANDSESQNAVQNALAPPQRDVLQQWVHASNPAVHGGYEYSANTEEDPSTLAYMENTYNPNIFTLEVDTAQLTEMPPGQIRVSPSNPYASVVTDVEVPSTSLTSNNALGIDLSQISTDDLAAFSNFFNNFTAQENVVKDGPFGEGGVEGLGVVTNGDSGNLNFNFDSGFDFQLGFNPNASLLGFSNDGLTMQAPEVPNAQFIPANEGFNFGLDAGFDTTGFDMSQTQVGPSNALDEEQVIGRNAHLQQSQILPTPPITESSPTSAGSAGDKRGQNSPVEPRPRSYMPPPGAMNATMRRAAGTWRPPPNLLNDEE